MKCKKCEERKNYILNLKLKNLAHLEWLREDAILKNNKEAVENLSNDIEIKEKQIKQLGVE